LNSCEFQVDRIDIAVLKAWLNKWLKIDNEITDEELSIAVYSRTEPAINGDNLSFIIDFGNDRNRFDRIFRNFN
jgi:hypothetical protein